jgi:hypothetical protein
MGSIAIPPKWCGSFAREKGFSGCFVPRVAEID